MLSSVNTFFNTARGGFGSWSGPVSGSVKWSDPESGSVKWFGPESRSVKIFGIADPGS